MPASVFVSITEIKEHYRQNLEKANSTSRDMGILQNGAFGYDYLRRI